VVWIAPVVFGIVALAGLLFAFARWRKNTTQPLDPEDEALVAAFRSTQHHDSQQP
jgi:cytochrome c-type biogenesis protein CcmH/NrfF